LDSEGRLTTRKSGHGPWGFVPPSESKVKGPGVGGGGT